MSLKSTFDDPRTWRKFHGVMTLIWIALIPPSLLILRESVPWIVFMSVWANVGTHFGAWQGSRAEVESADNPPQTD